MDYQNIGKVNIMPACFASTEILGLFLQDRSLGAVELKLSDLTVADRDNHDFPYTSNGKIDRNSPIILDKNTSKGFLEYEAEFVPSLNIKGIEFDQRNELEKAVEEGARESGAQGDVGDDVASADGSVSSSDEDHEKVPEGITVGEPTTPTTPVRPATPSRARGQQITDITTLGDTTASERNRSASPARGSVEVSREQLLHTCKCSCRMRRPLVSPWAVHSRWHSHFQRQVWPNLPQGPVGGSPGRLLLASVCH